MLRDQVSKLKRVQEAHNSLAVKCAKLEEKLLVLERELGDKKSTIERLEQLKSTLVHEHNILRNRLLVNPANVTGPSSFRLKAASQNAGMHILLSGP